MPEAVDREKDVPEEDMPEEDVPEEDAGGECRRRTGKKKETECEGRRDF